LATFHSKSATESELITELQTAGAMVYALTNPSNDYDEFDKIVAQTGGKLFNVTADFNVILGEIGTTLSAQYHLQYETDNLRTKALPCKKLLRPITRLPPPSR